MNQQTTQAQTATIIEIARTDFQISTYAQQKNSLKNYAHTFTLENENQPPDHFYLWYYLEYITSFTYLGIKDIPLEGDGPFKNFKILLMTANRRGIPKRCYDEDKYEFCHLFARQQKGEPVLIAECSVKENATELIEEMAKHLNPQQLDTEKWPKDFRFSSLQLTQAMALAAYTIKNGDTNPNHKK